MKSIYLAILPVCAAFVSCQENKETAPSEKADTANQTTNSDDVIQTLYASVDSTFIIDDQHFTVHVDQHDLTEQMYAQGDTLQRPTYACVMEIVSGSGESLFRDSLTRDSWGYPGKIESIDAYQITMPELVFNDPEIVASYRIFELSSMDAISGSVAFNVSTHETRFYWEESFLED